MANLKKKSGVLCVLLMFMTSLCVILPASAVLSPCVSVWIGREPTQSVPKTQVSSQVNDPVGIRIHTALVYSGLGGTYSDRFPLLWGPSSWNHTICVTASKHGYRDTRETFLFVNSDGDFSISVSPSSIIADQGESISLTTTLTSINGFDSPVSLSLAGTPSGVSHNFAPNPIIPTGSANLTIHTSISTPPDSYNLMIAASGGGKTHLASVMLTVTGRGYSPPLTTILVAIVVFVAAFSLGAFWMRRRLISRLPKERSPASSSNSKRALRNISL